ncbi:MAG: bifunctional folylpolyglutamate synthase/dihydrofolate synthase [Ignavibacteriaceae bacterium]|nr:bifunctional folylpolyglutamate synthase/dihydrofolate synthase [Ignavibacteriaceae bacterium]
MDVETSLKKLFSLHNFGVKLGLENTVNFLNYLGNPQKTLKIIHLAGSNGKGSTASFIASILQESGFRIGLYTSPHFIKFNERVQINGLQIDDKYIAEFMTEHEVYIDQYQLTFFEVTTALAFKYFAEKNTDYCIIETGLGGRLDATNVLNPNAVVITTISLEHINVLGNTLKQIASEKAEIIKPRVKVFTGKLEPEVEKVIQEKCVQTNSELFQLKNFFNEELILKIGKNEIDFNNIEIPLKGNYQKYNAALASLVVSKIFNLYNTSIFRNGIKNVCKNTCIQGRYEYFHKNPFIIFDSAHNSESIENFLTEFEKESNQFSKKVLLFGAMRDKSIEEMIVSLKPHFDEIVLTEIEYERSAKINELKRICKKNNIAAEVTNSPAEFVRNFRTREYSNCLVVLGSIYLLGEVKSKLILEVT